MTLSVRAARWEDAALIAPLLRARDRIEMMRATGPDIVTTLQQSIDLSRHAGLFLADGTPVCIFGVMPMSLVHHDEGCPWLVGTTALDRHPKAFLRETRRWIEEWRQEYRVLVNWVDADYAGAIRWLAWLGFKIHDPAPYGALGALFCRVEMRTE